MELPWFIYPFIGAAITLPLVFPIGFIWNSYFDYFPSGWMKNLLSYYKSLDKDHQTSPILFLLIERVNSSFGLKAFFGKFLIFLFLFRGVVVERVSRLILRLAKRLHRLALKNMGQPALSYFFSDERGDVAQVRNERS